MVLGSRQAKVDQVTERINRVLGARGIAVQVDERYMLPDLTFETSDDTFAAASGGRSSDLSVKRNIGLLLARLHGWRKIAFIDDDITVSKQNIARLAHQLDYHQITGMVCREFPDNSVFCHARRLAQLPQDVFITGAVLGVNCSDLPLPFFADIYNEDWFFFAEAVAYRRLTKVGDAQQAEYDPYAEPTRASHEEFGDLMAEGLYSVIQGLRAQTDLRRSRVSSTRSASSPRRGTGRPSSKSADAAWPRPGPSWKDLRVETTAAIRFLPHLSHWKAADKRYRNHQSIRSPPSTASTFSRLCSATSTSGTRSTSAPITSARPTTPWIGWASRTGNLFG